MPRGVRNYKTKKIMVLEALAKMNSGPYRWIDIVRKALSEAKISQGYFNDIFREFVEHGFVRKDGYFYYINHEKINEYLNNFYKKVNINDLREARK